MEEHGYRELVGSIRAGRDTRVERSPFAVPGFRMTRRFFERLAALCTRLPVSTVARMAGLSWATVAKVDGRAIELALGDRGSALDDLRWIGVVDIRFV